MRPFRPTSIKSFGSSLRTWGTARDGGVAVTAAVMTTVLVGVLALSIDIGRIYNASSDLNHAADAYALAGATQLDGQDGACLRAIRAVNTAALANQETFGSNSPGPAAFVSGIESPVVNNPNIQFLSELVKDADGNVTGTYITDENTCDEEAAFIEIFLDRTSDDNPYRVDLYFAGVTGALTEAFPQGYAIAESVTAFCITVPMMMCALDGHPLLPANTSFIEALENFELTGNGLYLKSVNQNQQWGSGNFGFLDLGQGPLCDYIGPIRPDPQCLTDGEIFTKTGSTSGARHCFNTRFDIWQGPVGGSMGDRNYQPSANGVKGLIRNGDSCAYGGGGGYNDPPTPYTGYGSYGAPPSQATLPPQAAMPPPRDKCAYSDPPTCPGFQGRMGNGEWDRATYMEVNHNTTAYSAVPSDMNFSGDQSWDINWPRGPHPDGEWSRYEMYLWELDRPYASYTAHGGGGGGFGEVGPNHRLPDNTAGAAGPDPIPQVGEYAGDRDLANGDGLPQCYVGPMGVGGSIAEEDFDRDRRVERILVVNCDPANGGVDVSGKTEIPISAIQGTMEVFLMEPWKVNGGVHEISTEIIGPGGAVIDDKFIPDDLKKEWVQLKEGRNALK